MERGGVGIMYHVLVLDVAPCSMVWCIYKAVVVAVAVSVVVVVVVVVLQ